MNDQTHVRAEALRTARRDHYVPQFILKRFRPHGTGRLHYLEKGAQKIETRGVRRIFCELDGDLLLKGPPAIKQKGRLAVLAEPPEYTTGIRDDLSRRERRWAPAIRRLVATSLQENLKHPQLSSIVPAIRAPNGFDDWTALAKDYCIRQMMRSPDAGNELWAKMMDTEAQDLRAWIRTVLGQALEPSDELSKIWRQHNRHKIRTGAEADAEGLWNDVDSVFILTTWVISDDSQFVIGSKGGVWVGTQAEELWICPVDPRVAIGIEGRRISAQAMGIPELIGQNNNFTKGYVLPREDLTVQGINRASLEQCQAVAARRLQDIEEAVGDGPLPIG